MRFFRRRKRRAAASASGIRISDLLGGLQRRLAERLNRKTAYWNRTSKVIALLFWCLLFGGACLYLLVHAAGLVRFFHH